MKTLCLLLDSQDTNWISDYLESKSNKESITLVAPSFEGRIIAETLNLKYISYDKEAWSINKDKLFDLARIQSYNWHLLPEIHEDPLIESFMDFNGYPLLVMHQSYLLLAIWEILQAFDFISKAIKKERPQKVVAGKRDNPFNSNRLFILTGSNGLEREAARAYCINNNIEFSYIPAFSPSAAEKQSISRKNKVLIDKILKSIRNPELVFQKALAIFSKRPKTKISNIKKPFSQLLWNSSWTGLNILIFAWGNYYFKQLSETFNLLLKNNARIKIVIIGGTIAEEERDNLIEKKICISKRSDWSVENEKNILNDWKVKGELAYKNISKSNVLTKYFSNEYGSYFPGLVELAIKRELVENIPSTVVNLLRSEKIIRTFAPDLVFCHFALHPEESCDVLPARKLGIPTITSDHGVPGYYNSERNTFSTQYYAVVGSLHKNALMRSLKCSSNVLLPVGDSRFESIQLTEDTWNAKRKFGFNPDKPICIFCDSSGFTQSPVWRHSTFKTIEQIINLKNHIPDLQIIYRVHHGANHDQMQKYFYKLGIPEITFQISPSPLFIDIVQAADVVISHPTSAITEALLCGVRVIYLCALSNIEPSFLNHDVIKVADTFELLPELVKNIIENPMTREKVRLLAQPYFNKKLCGNDGKATERLAKLMLRLAKTPINEWKKGHQDWIDRIESSCEFKSEDWNTSNIIL